MEAVLNKPILSEQQKRDFCAELLKKYGLQIDINNELLPVLYLAYSAGEISQKTSRETRESINKIIKEFESKTLKRPDTTKITFQNSKDAFWYTFGSVGLPMIVISLLFVTCWYFYQEAERKKWVYEQKKDQMYLLVKSTPIEEKQLNDSTKVTKIRFYPSKDFEQAVVGKNYVYNKTCDCIELPLFYSKY